MAQSYDSGLLVRRPDNWLSSVFYGGIIEEVLLRLFLMSLAAFLIWKLFFRNCKREEIPQGVFFVVNILCAILFAAGHLPATVAMSGTLTPRWWPAASSSTAAWAWSSVGSTVGTASTPCSATPGHISSPSSSGLC